MCGALGVGIRRFGGCEVWGDGGWVLLVWVHEAGGCWGFGGGGGVVGLARLS